MRDASAVTGAARPLPAYTAEQVRAAEAPLLAVGEPLMDRAAGALATIVGRVTSAGQRILVLAGGGDNGGDALLAGAALAESGVNVDILATAERIHERGAAAAAAGCRSIGLAEAARTADSGGYDLIVDGMLGIGARGGLRGGAHETATTLARAVGGGRASVIAVDLPSGLDPDTGEAGDDVLPATTTVTFGAPKIGLARGRGAQLAGRVVLVELGLALTKADSPGTVTAEVYRA